ncbi:hypothetical protein ACFYYB_09455 [Streptomyces sp. NPDC002886]
MLFVSTAISYLDRSILSIVAPDVSRDIPAAASSTGSGRAPSTPGR